MICPVFSFIAAESRQTSGHWSRVFPQVFTCHRCPSARKVCDVNKTLQQHGCLCLQMQKIVASWCIFSILNIWLNTFLWSHWDFLVAWNVFFKSTLNLWCINIIIIYYFFYFTLFIIIINRTCLRLGAVLWSATVPFLVCKSYGLIGYMRLVVQEHTGESRRLN